MVSTLVKSLVAVVLLGAGLAAGRATARSPSSPARAEGTCTATIECKDGECFIHWTAQDGRTGEIELSCKDGECKVVRCDPCCTDGCCGSSEHATATKATPTGSGCCK